MKKAAKDKTLAFICNLCLELRLHQPIGLRIKKAKEKTKNILVVGRSCQDYCLYYSLVSR
jgi:hypothetical protein